MASRSVLQWHDVFEGMTFSEQVFFILKDLTHYSTGRAFEADDRETLANAIIACRTATPSARVGEAERT